MDTASSSNGASGSAASASTVSSSSVMHATLAHSVLQVTSVAGDQVKVKTPSLCPSDTDRMSQAHRLAGSGRA
jgi:hypothetical protein